MANARILWFSLSVWASMVDGMFYESCSGMRIITIAVRHPSAFGMSLIMTLLLRYLTTIQELFLHNFRFGPRSTFSFFLGFLRGANLVLILLLYIFVFGVTFVGSSTYAFGFGFALFTV